MAWWMALRDLSSTLVQSLSAPRANASHMTGKLCAAAALYNSRSGCSFEISSSPINMMHCICNNLYEQYGYASQSEQHFWVFSILWKANKLMAFGYKLQRKISGQRYEMRRCWWELHNKKHHNWYSYHNSNLLKLPQYPHYLNKCHLKNSHISRHTPLIGMS